MSAESRASDLKNVQRLIEKIFTYRVQYSVELEINCNSLLLIPWLTRNYSSVYNYRV